MDVTTTEPADAGLERLHWTVDLGGRSRGLDLLPAAVGSSVAVEIDGRPVGYLSKPTRQHPWREATFRTDGDSFQVALVWSFPVMQTDVFVGGRSVRDERSLDAARADAPRSLSNYEVGFGTIFPGPSAESRRHASRGWAIAVSACVLIWVLAFVLSPFPPELRLVAAAGLLVSGIVLMLAFLWSMFAVGRRVHEALLARPSLGDWLFVLWFAAFAGYTVLGVLEFGLILAIAAN